jgi:hypothetical protein
MGSALGRPPVLLLVGSAVGLLLGVIASRVLAQIAYLATPRDPLVLGGTMITMALLAYSRPGFGRSVLWEWTRQDWSGRNDEASCDRGPGEDEIGCESVRADESRPCMRIAALRTDGMGLLAKPTKRPGIGGPPGWA